jgi:hypothetical protein
MRAADMQRRPTVIRGTSARDLAEHGLGYSANGESQYSRNAAATAANIVLSKGKRTDGRLLRENENQLAKITRRLAIETDPAKIMKLRQDREIKTRFVNKLRSEI